MVRIKVDVRKELARFKAVAGKEAPKMLREFMLTHARNLVSSRNANVPGLIQITPPLTKFGSKLSNAAAKKIGEGAVANDIGRVYAGPGKVYGMMRKDNPRVAGAFWRMVKAKQWSQASMFAMANDFPGLSAWDDGRLHGDLHRRFARGRIQSTKHQIFLREIGHKGQPMPSVKSYLKKRQARVGLLAGAILRNARIAFGAIGNVPKIAESHGNTGWASCSITQRGGDITVRVENNSPYQMRDLTRLYNYVASRRILAIKNALKNAAKALENKLKT